MPLILPSNPDIVKVTSLDKFEKLKVVELEPFKTLGLKFPVPLLQSPTSQASGTPLPSRSIVSSPPGQISSPSQTPSPSESAKVPAQLQSGPYTSFMVHESPSSQLVPIRLSSRSGH